MPPRRASGEQPAVAVPARLPQESGDGRIGHPVEQGADRQDARRRSTGTRSSCSSNMARASAPSPGRSSTGCRPDATLIAIDTNAGLHRLSEEGHRRSTADRGHRLGRRRRRRSSRRTASPMPITSCPACPSRPCRPASARRSARRPPSVIRAGGAFLVYQFSPKVRDFIAPHFERIDRGFEWINVPPATLFWAWREPESRSRRIIYSAPKLRRRVTV